LANSPSYQNRGRLRLFRKKAEAMINGDADAYRNFNAGEMDIRELLNELQIFRLQLEMQNEELVLSHERVEAERSKFAGLYDLAPVGYFILDRVGTITEVNNTVLDMLGVDRRALIGKRIQHYVDKSSADLFYRFIHKMRESKAKSDCQVMLVAGTRSFYVHAAGADIRDRTTGDERFYIAVIDISERKTAEHHLHETNERLKMTLEATAMGTWEIDLKKQRIILGHHSYSILGLNQWEFDGQYDTFFRAVHPKHKERVKQTMIDAIKNRKDIDIEYPVLLGHGTRYLSVRGQVMDVDAGVSRFVGIIMDITEKKQLEEEAENLKRNNQNSIITAGLQAQEKERKRISEALHDSVSQLLYGIKLNLQELSSPEAATGERLLNINMLLDQAINETRDISFQLAPSILHDFGLAESVKEMAKRMSTPGFCISVKTPDRSHRLKPELEISAFRIIQELVNNSIKHGRATETIVSINLLKDQIIITVKDNGEGFDMQDPGYLLRGSGLLSIKNRVSLLNGTFDIRSAAKKGTSVTIILKYD